MKNLILLIFLMSISINAFAQTVNNDLTFNQSGNGFDGQVEKTLIQPNGKILVAGGSTTYNNVSIYGISRLNPDGTLDPTFNTSAVNLPLYTAVSIALQADGKIVGVGYGVFRVNSDGTEDITFNPPSWSECSAVAIQSDGKILVGSTNFNNHIARLNSDGSIDATFNPGLGFAQIGIWGVIISTISIQNDGKILVGGKFSSYNNVARNGITRLNSDGTLDTTFDPGLGIHNEYALTTYIQSDSKIIVGGNFYAYNNVSRNGIVRINPDGTLDTTFDPGSGFNSTVCSMGIQTDGKIVLGGLFTIYNGITRNKISRLNPDGTLDLTFDPGSGFDSHVNSIGIQTDGKIIAGGSFTNFRGLQRGYLTRLRMDCNNTIATNDILNISSCAPYISPGNQSYSQPGTYFETLLTSTGCDSSYLTIILDILPISSGSFNASFCYGTSYLWNNITYNQPGQYQQTLTNQFGCDSLVTLNLTVIPNNFNPTFSSTQQLYTALPFATQFSNSTANSSNYSFVWHWGDGTSTSSNNASVFHEYLYNGLYTVSLVATDNVTGCTDTTTITDYIYCTGGASCAHTATISQQGPLQACAGTDVWLSCNNDPSFTYQWRRDGVNIPGNNNDSLLITQTGNYTVSIYVNSCPVTSNGISVTINPLPNVPTITPTGTITSCSGGSLTLSAPAGLSSYSWNTGATSSSITVTQSGNYSVTVTNSNGCARISAPYVVNASFMLSPNVCVVGMDSLTNENRIVWEKPITTGIDSFYVYKETNVSDVYTKIGATNYPDLAVFLDQNSNPAVQAYRYKLAVLDTCGTETLLSDFHKTIHLTINAGVGGAWNLIWSHYEGLAFGSYRIYRGTSLSNMSLLTTIQSNLNSYTDLAPPVGPVYYQIEIVNPNSCDPTKVVNYNVSLSNIVNNGVNGINTLTNSTVMVYPNPTTMDDLTITSTDALYDEYIIFDPQGRKVLSGTLTGTTTQLNLSSLARGNYLLQIGEKKTPIKLIKQ